MPNRAVELLRDVAMLCGRGGGLLIGIDLKKDPAKIEAAYNDALGITDQFNLNLLQRINRELDGNFCLDQFQHRAVYNAEFGRVEIDLVSRCNQCVVVGGRVFDFKSGEAIRTEYSYKYSIEEFAAMAAPTGLVLHRQWTDRQRNFAVLHLVIE